MPEKCCIHIFGGGEEEDEILPFTEPFFRRCRLVLRARKFHNLKYSTFILPNAHDDGNIGYHTKCWRLFSALKTPQLLSVPHDYDVTSAPVALASGESPSHVIQTIREKSKRAKKTEKRLGVLGDFCIFCRKKNVKYQNKKQKLYTCRTDDFDTRVRRSAQSLSDFAMKALLSDGDLCAKEGQYHKLCSLRYFSKAKIKQRTKDGYSDITKHRADNAKAFESLYEFIEQRIFNNEEILSTQDLFKVYSEFRKEISPDISDQDINTYPLPKFEAKILIHFSARIMLDKRSKHHIFFSKSMDYREGVIQGKLDDINRLSLLTRAALELRKAIMSTERNPFGPTITPDDILKGECKVPIEVRTFFQDVMRGPSNREVPEITRRRADSLAQDLVFCSTSGRLKPPKHLTLGSAIKTMTGSKKLLTLMNRMGHTVSYTTVEELETEMSYAALETSSILPAAIKPESDLCTTVAFDNFDRFVDTANGKDTLHDTVAVVYQNAVRTGETSVDLPHTSSSHTSRQPSSELAKKRRRRTYDETYGEITAYNKVPNKPFEVSQAVANLNVPAIDFSYLDIVWMMSVAHEVAQTPMWVGFNAKLLKDDLPRQNIAYLPQINHSPTSYSVVAHTLKIAQNVAEECGQHGIICAYDLNIARMALQIQNDDAPVYDDVFVMLGAFHVELSFFKALGKVIEGSGATDILEECDLIAGGSMNAFLGGTHYNRCKRLHEYLAISLRILHYQRFIASCSDADNNEDMDMDRVTKLLRDIGKLPTTGAANISLDPELQNHVEKYRSFECSTSNGEHGATAQFWIHYVRLYDLYHNLTRSIRMGQTGLFMETLISMTDVFFAVNHHNYARWLVVFTDKLRSGLERQDSIGAQLRAGMISVRRTKKDFSRTAPDLTLEQTINADAANKMTGISAFTNSIAARQRWAVSHSQRTQLVTQVMEEAGITKKEDITSQLIPSKIIADNGNVKKLINTFNDFLNPFSHELQKEYLYNLATGKAASPEVHRFLLNLIKLGKDQHQKFRSECSDDPSRFKRPIKRNKISNFLSSNARPKVTKQGQVHELKQERNMFARLLTISMNNNIDLKSVFAYPLTAVPLSLSYSDGTKLATPKSSLLHHLESLCEHEPPTYQDVLIIDGFFFLHSSWSKSNHPSSYGSIAETILKKIGKLKIRTIHLVFDTYEVPSIKDIERSRRAADVDRFDQRFNITNPGQKLSGDISKLLKIDHFKEQLVHFLTSEWSKDDYTKYFEGFTLFVNDKHTCYQFVNHNGAVMRHEVETFSNSHVEADSKIGYLLTKLEEGNVVVRSSDTDVLVIILGNIQHMSDSMTIWLETGTISNNTYRFINVSNIREQLGAHLSKALPAFHALTGSDYTSSFYRLGKKKPFQVVNSNTQYQKTLAQFGDKHKLDNEEISSLHQIVCSFYTKRPISNPDELRLQMFSDIFKKRSKTQPLLVKKCMEATSFPPCKRVLYQKFLRAKFVTLFWTNLNNPEPPQLSPTDYGWELLNGTFHIIWFTGPCLPCSLEDIICKTDVTMTNEHQNEIVDDCSTDDDIQPSSDDSDEE